MQIAALGEAAELIAAEQSRRDAAYREARDAVAPLLRLQADAEVARARWLKQRRGVPSHVLYDVETGEPRDGTLRVLTEAVRAAEADARWCMAVEVATAEELKGETLEAVMARNEANRARVTGQRARALAAVNGGGA